ncbi:DNA-binding MurR/RpiR family transcriptional regulator [Microbacterium resistens]|uniref:DNA-binding MurR/RpiR family transcriptional regulator n=1 Tax=Microbacterium resistens TaxID=156977 RepID=A0ABU1S9F2_9MICO|nr:MurR/RpiR family transcriptional regulator [Microbacterium resistens]MDR6866221.1 DNA-binding MurR/RpiR family transcriptional regulator [Microbacterium resistens]
MNGVLVRLREVSGDVGAAEQRAVEFILDNAEYVMRHPLNEVSEACEVGEATIIRLCRRVELTGFRELRMALAQDQVGETAPAIHEDVLHTDDDATLLAKVFASFANALADTLSVVDIEQFSRAVETVSVARSINFFGFGASGATAESAHFRFMRLGMPSYVLTDVAAQLSRVTMLGPGDVVVAISHSGHTRDLVFAVESARAKGATVIAVTQYGRNELASSADLTLSTSSVETAFRSEAMASRVAQHTLLDALFVAVSLPRSEQVIAAIEENHRLIEALHDN